MRSYKKALFLFLFSIFVFFIIAPNIILAKADTSQKAEDELWGIVSEQIDALDLEALQEYIESLDNFDSVNIKEQLINYIKGEEINYQGFIKTLLQVLFSKVLELLPAFACIMAITLLSGLISMLGTASNGVTTTNVISMITYVSSLIPLMVVLIECFSQTLGAIREMKTQMDIIYPIMLTLMTASGGTLSATICKPAVAFFSTGIVSIITSAVLPITILIVVFSVAGNFTKDLKIGRFGEFFKSINKWLLGLSVSVFGLFFTLQGLTASTYDGVVKRAAKYAIGNGIPIVGGFLSSGFDLAIAGSVLIKNSLGSMGIFLMLWVILQPIVLLLSVTLLLRLSCAVTQLIGDGRISDFLGETANNLRFCTAGILIMTFLYFLSIVLMISSSEALF
jgi:stage III sporulation protein AE